jgi:hypothetical protein
MIKGRDKQKTRFVGSFVNKNSYISSEILGEAVGIP